MLAPIFEDEPGTRGEVFHGLRDDDLRCIGHSSDPSADADRYTPDSARSLWVASIGCCVVLAAAKTSDTNAHTPNSTRRNAAAKMRDVSNLSARSLMGRVALQANPGAATSLRHQESGHVPSPQQT